MNLICKEYYIMKEMNVTDISGAFREQGTINALGYWNNICISNL